MCCPLYNEARTEAGLQHFAHNAASFVQILMDVRESKLKALATFLFTAFPIRENQMHLNHSSFVCTVLIDNVVHAVTLVRMYMYVCMYCSECKCMEALRTQTKLNLNLNCLFV
jgi:hypothetical protein